MSTIRSVLGRLNKSMGNVTFSTWKGKNIAKQRVPERNTSNSPAQAAQRRKFAALAKLAGQLGPAIRVGFRVAATDKTEQNVFTKVNFDAVTDNGTEAVVDYTLLKVSSGTVAGVAGLNAVLVAVNGIVTVTWADNSDGNTALPTDVIYLEVINKETGKTWFKLGPANRAAGTAEVLVDVNQAAANLVAYAFFKRLTSTSTSPSAYDQVS